MKKWQIWAATAGGVIAGVVLAAPAVSVANEAANALAFHVWNAGQLWPSKPLDITTDRVKRQRRADPEIVATVEKARRAFGVRQDLSDFTVQQESGWRVTAANPASTARGLFQVIKGTHAEIIGRPLSYQEHRALSFKPDHHVNVGMAHLRMCQDAMPGASARQIWKRCHHDGPGAAGTTMKVAQNHYRRVVGGSFPTTVNAYAPPVGSFGVTIIPASFVPSSYRSAR